MNAVKIAGYLIFFFCFYQSILSQNIFDDFVLPEETNSSIDSKEIPLDDFAIPGENQKSPSEEDIFPSFLFDVPPIKNSAINSQEETPGIESKIEKNFQKFLEYFNFYLDYKKIKESFESSTEMEKENEGLCPLLTRFLFEYNIFGVNKNCLYNPKNIYHLPHNYSRILVSFDFFYPLYEEEKFKLDFTFRDTLAYRSKSDNYADNSVENYIQEAFLGISYEYLRLWIGKKNVSPGSGGGYAWNVIDVFSHNSTLFKANAENWDKIYTRPGLYGLYGSYSFEFGDIFFAYTPDLTKRKNDNNVARNDTEFVDNTSDILFIKFSWRNFFTKDILGQPPIDIIPSAPDFIFSYRSNSLTFVESNGEYVPVYQQDDTYNVGFLWSIGIGDSIIFRTELNYSTTTDIQEIKQTGRFVPEDTKKFQFTQRNGPNFGMILSFSYIFSDIMLDLEYYYNANGYSRNELEDYYNNIKYINKNYLNPSSPLLKEYYLNKLSYAIFFDANILGKHYAHTSLSREWNIGEKKRSLSLNLYNVLSLQDVSGRMGAFVTYSFFDYAKIKLDFNYFYGKEKSLFGSNPYEWMFLGTLDLKF